MKILRAVAFLHSNKFVHGDLKLSNIMIDSRKNICIVDFGYSLKVASQNELISNYSGTPAYIAPEIIGKKPFNGNFD